MGTTDAELTRRQVLKTAVRKAPASVLAAGAFSLLAPSAQAGAHDEEEYDFLMPRVKFACDQRVIDTWNVHPGGDRNLLEEFSKVIRCKVKLAQNCYCESPYYGDEPHFNAVVDLADPAELRKYPFLFMTAEGYFKLARQQEENLKRYLDEGGFIFMDDCIYAIGSDFFYQSAYKTLESMFGAGAVVTVPNSHEVFNNVYDLSSIGLPFVSGKNHGAKGVFVGDRLVAFLSSTDIHCGWTDRHRKWYSRTDGSPHDYKEAIQLGINLIMYTLSH